MWRALHGLRREPAAAVAAIGRVPRPGGAIAERLGLPDLPGRLPFVVRRMELAADGEDWLLDAGAEHARLRDSRGMHYLRALLAAPGRDIPALDLVAGGTGLVGSGAEPLLDATARDAHRCRIRELDSELAAADRAGDIAAAGRAQDERQTLIAQLPQATERAGRPRRVAADAERARVNVTRTIRVAVDCIAAVAPIAGAYLQASIHTGTACRYQPGPGGPAR